jgi:integrase
MPKLNYNNGDKPKKSNDRGRCYSSYIDGNGKRKRVYFGKFGTPEADEKYRRFVADLMMNPTLAVQNIGNCVGIGDADVLVSELCDAFMEHYEPRLHRSHVIHFKRAIGFLVGLYGGMSANEITPKKLRSVRNQMVQYGKLCRKMINAYTTQLIRIFVWGVEEEWVEASTAGALKLIKHLPPNEPGTFDHEEREDVPLDVIRRTLPFASPTVQAMIQVQYLTGMRPSEVCKMTVERIDRTQGNGLWYYNLGKLHKTAKHIGKKAIPLSKAVQALIAPYLVGKKGPEAVFSPRQAMIEHLAARRASRKTKVPPSQQSRDKRNADNPTGRAGEFYDRNSYRIAIANAIKKGNKILPDDQKIPAWFPYLLRNACATHVELSHGLDAAQSQLGHKKADMTRRYSRAQLKVREKLAREQKNPFADSSEGGEPVAK